MKNVLLIGALLNFVGGIGIIASIFKKIPYGFSMVPKSDEIKPNDYMLFRLFTAGTAFWYLGKFMRHNRVYQNSTFPFPLIIPGCTLLNLKRRFLSLPGRVRVT
jgi:hypothetical protein